MREWILEDSLHITPSIYIFGFYENGVDLREPHLEIETVRMERVYRAGFFNLDTVEYLDWGWMLFFVVGGDPVLCKMFKC